jgi:hypothetical protein
VTIDAKGIQEGDGAIVVIECRRHTMSHISQEQMGAVAWRVIDTGAARGITISPHPLQRGAVKVAKAGRVEHVLLTPDSTRERWVAQLRDMMALGFTEKARVSIAEAIQITVRDAATGKVIEERSL